MNVDHIFIHVTDNGRYQAYESLTGIDRRNQGPRFDTPAEAKAYIESLAAIEDVSPLRDPSRSEPNELVVLGGMTDGSSAQNEVDPGRPPGDRLTSEDGTRVSASSQSGQGVTSLALWPD